jgi:hypothetical protein
MRAHVRTESPLTSSLVAAAQDALANELMRRITALWSFSGNPPVRDAQTTWLTANEAHNGAQNTPVPPSSLPPPSPRAGADLPSDVRALDAILGAEDGADDG